MSAVGQRVGARVGHRVGQTLGRSGSDPRLLDFSDGAFSRNNGSIGSGSNTSYRLSSNTWVDGVLPDVLRAEILGGVSRYLFERQVNNYIGNSDNQSSGWSLNSVTVAADSADVVDPIGTNTADRLTYGATASHSISQNISDALLPNNTEFNISVWLRTLSGTLGRRLGVRLRTGADDLTSISVTSAWQRFNYQHNAGTGASAVILRLYNASPAEAGDIYAIRAQVERGKYPTSGLLTTAAAIRYADTLVMPPDEVPLAFRSTGFACNVRPLWATADLADGEERVLCSTDANNRVTFRKSGASSYLSCYTGGVLRFEVAASVARDTDYPIVCNFATGVMTFNGVAGSTGTATSLPGGVALRWGGTAGGANELDGGTDEPVSI